MARRTGLRTIRNLAQQSCKFIAVFKPIIVVTFPSSTALHAQLDIVLDACGTLVTLADQALPPGD